MLRGKQQIISVNIHCVIVNIFLVLFKYFTANLYDLCIVYMSVFVTQYYIK